jgi:hypothetical protein
MHLSFASQKKVVKTVNRKYSSVRDPKRIDEQLRLNYSSDTEAD